MAFPRITLRDIAAQAGVHVTTVSKALRNHASLPADTCKRLQKLAEEMGYQPDPMLSALWAYRRVIKPKRGAPVIGYLTAWPTREAWKKDRPAYASFFDGAQKRAADLGYQFEHFWLREPGMSARRWTKVFLTRNTGGLIISSDAFSLGRLRLDWSKFCAVKVEQSFLWPPLHCTANNQVQIVRLAVRQARRRGYRRIGLVMEQVNDETVRRSWSAGFLAEQLRHPPTQRVPALLFRKSSSKFFFEWLDAQRPDVLLSNQLFLLEWLKAAGRRVPEDVGFIDLDCWDRAGATAGIKQHHEAVGASAVDTLIGLMQRNERGIPDVPQLTMLEGEWIEGATIRRIRT